MDCAIVIVQSWLVEGENPGFPVGDAFRPFDLNAAKVSRIDRCGPPHDRGNVMGICVLVMPRDRPALGNSKEFNAKMILPIRDQICP